MIEVSTTFKKLFIVLDKLKSLSSLSALINCLKLSIVSDKYYVFLFIMSIFLSKSLSAKIPNSLSSLEAVEIEDIIDNGCLH